MVSGGSKQVSFLVCYGHARKYRANHKAQITILGDKWNYIGDAQKNLVQAIPTFNTRTRRAETAGSQYRAKTPHGSGFDRHQSLSSMSTMRASLDSRAACVSRCRKCMHHILESRHHKTFLLLIDNQLKNLMRSSKTKLNVTQGNLRYQTPVPYLRAPQFKPACMQWRQTFI